MNNYDVIDVLIVGAGPIGLSCGIEARKEGFSHLIVDKGTLTNSIYHFPENMHFFPTSDRLEIGDVPFMFLNARPTKKEALEYYRRIAFHWKLNLLFYQSVQSINFEKGLFLVQTQDHQLIARTVILAIGFYDTPNLMNIDGENLPKVSHYFKDAHPYIGQKLLIIGAGNSAVDAALEAYRKGVQVTLAIREKDFKDSVKYWILPDIKNRIAEGSIKAYFETETLQIKNHSVVLKNKEKIFEIENDFVLAMTGYQPDYSFLKSTGIKIKDDFFKTPWHNPETFETNVKGLYLAGVVSGGLNTGKWFIENARFHSQKIFAHLKSRRLKN